MQARDPDGATASGPGATSAGPTGRASRWSCWRSAKLFDPSLLWWRLLRVAADATAARARLGARARPGGPRWALAAWAAAAVTAAQPTSANPYRPGARLRARRRAARHARASRPGRAAGRAGGVLAPGRGRDRGAGGRGDRGPARAARRTRRRAARARGAAAPCSRRPRRAAVVLYLPVRRRGGPRTAVDALVVQSRPATARAGGCRSRSPTTAAARWPPRRWRGPQGRARLLPAARGARARARRVAARLRPAMAARSRLLVLGRRLRSSTCSREPTT